MGFCSCANTVESLRNRRRVARGTRLLFCAALVGAAMAVGAGQSADPAKRETAPHPSVPSSADLQEILKKYEAYHALAPAEKAGTPRPVFLYPELSKEAPMPDGVAEMEKRTLTTAPDLLMRAQDRMALKRFADAAADLEEALKLEPADASTHLRVLLQLYGIQKDTARVVDTYRRLAAALPDNALAQFEAAMMLMICEPETLRDDKTALRFAERAMELTQFKNPQFARALGLAYFRNGRKEKAVETVKAALALLPAGQLPNLRADLEAALKTYSGEEERRNPDGPPKPNEDAGADLTRRVETEHVVIHTDLPEARARHYASFFVRQDRVRMAGLATGKQRADGLE